jgi:hypothetical protein
MGGLSAQELNEIERRWSATTPGPWKSLVEGRDFDSGSSFIQTGGKDIYLSGGTIADQDFIASAHQDIQKLIAEVRTLRGSQLYQPGLGAPGQPHSLLADLI